MNGKLRVAIFIASITITAVLVGFAWFNNYEFILEKPNVYLVLLLLFINIIANIFQIIEFLEEHLGRTKEVSQKKPDKIFYETTKNLGISYSNPSEVSEQEVPEKQ